MVCITSSYCGEHDGELSLWRGGVLIGSRIRLRLLLVASGWGSVRGGGQLEGWVCGVNFSGTCGYVQGEAQTEGWDSNTGFTVEE